MKECLVITRCPPYGSSLGREGLDAILMASAFTRVTCLFMDDGVFQLLEGQAPEQLGIKGHYRVFELLEQYGVTKVCVSATALAQRGIDAKRLVITAEVIDDISIRALVADHQFLLTF